MKLHAQTATALLLAATHHAGAAPDRLRPPAVPLVVHAPYFSLWSPSERLAEADTMHWTGKPQPLRLTITAGGKTYRLLGASQSGAASEPAEQTDLEALPTRTIARYKLPGVEVTLTFLTPALPTDLEALARPVTYVAWSARSTDGRPHGLTVALEGSALTAVNEGTQQAVAMRTTLGGLATCSAASVEQPVLAKRGDDLRIDWGRFCMAAPAPAATGWSIRGVAGHAGESPESPATDLALRLTAPARIAAGGGAASGWFILAYDDEWSIRYFRTRLRPYWRRNGDDLPALLRKAAADYPSLVKRCEAFDAKLMADLRRVGGEKYARLCALAYRQTLGGNKIAADAAGKPLMFPKECFSNGCIATVDVLFPQAPFFLSLSPALTKAMLQPVLAYSASPRWPYPYAPHDLGTYPWATGQVYGMGGTDADRMPVEECGNMLIMLASLAGIEGNADFSRPYMPMLAKWADFLVREGLDPVNQLCSADMFGHMPRNANLALKAVIGIGAYSRLCSATGQAEEAARTMSIARDYAAKWQVLAAGDGHTLLAYDRPGTWSMKHNLIWDRVLGLNLFPEALGDAEAAWYRKAQGRYGLPVDSRTETSLIDWALWSIALAGKPADFEEMLEPIYRYAHETPTRVPLSDWFVTTTGKRQGFQARPVVGGLFIRLLAEPATRARWSKAASRVDGPWAPLPAGGTVRVVAATAQTERVLWRYTLTEPASGWTEPGYDDSGWRQGPGGFGTAGTPGALVGTEWNTKAIWLRREFTLPDRPLNDPRLLLIYDEDPEVWLNGVPAASAKGWATGYDEMEISPAASQALRPGRNVMAVKASQTYGGQCIDVGLVEDAPK
ncbi:MAG: DUF4965 domain-containing protein [Armatimonadetes bacterium]|nr:DUF4965 domain-containing protein [Armatimonadota bacterium]